MTGTVPLWRRAAAAIGRTADRMSPAREKTSDERRAHMHAIEKIIARWQSGEIGTDEKRRLIAQENTFWYGREHKSSATGEVITSAGERVNHGTQPPASGDDDEEPEEWWKR